MTTNNTTEGGALVGRLSPTNDTLLQELSPYRAQNTHDLVYYDEQGKEVHRVAWYEVKGRPNTITIEDKTYTVTYKE